MELLRYESPFECHEVLKLWEEIFGIDEAILETPQVDGSEQRENYDVVFVAKENNQLLGTIHGTIPKSMPSICGLSAMCTTPAARGKGLGRILFSKIVEEMELQGVKTMYLGTGNPIAAKLYKSCGFSYLPGSKVMVRLDSGDLIDFTRDIIMVKPNAIEIRPGSADMRIPIIPLVLHRGPYMLLDCNTNLINCEYITQFACMSLYPRYMKLVEDGGAFWQARSETGVLGAVASVMPTKLGMRADFFCVESFSPAIKDLLICCENFAGEIYMQISDADAEKIKVAEEMGYTPVGQECISYRNVNIPCTIYKK